MRRRHLLALIILALVVATVLAMGPVRVWDAVTLRTVEEPWVNTLSAARYWPGNDTVTCGYRVRMWSVSTDFFDFELQQEPFRGHHQSGQLAIEACMPAEGLGYVRTWSVDGQMTTNVLIRDQRPYSGIETIWIQGVLDRRMQIIYVSGNSGMHTSPPWFTEEEILQSVEGVEE